MAASEVKRKLTTILSADVAGYSRLMGADEEATLRRLTAYRAAMDRLIGDHDGRVVGTAGDSLLAEFASTVEAARCAVAIQEALAKRNAGLPAERRLEFRIGINLGDVMVEGDDLFGDGVNVAARLQELAEPGGVYVSGGVHDQIHDKLDLGYRDLGAQEVKNIARPVRVYRLGAGEGVTGRRWPGRRPIFVAAVALLVVVSASLAGWTVYRWLPESPPALPEQPAIAVLPFDNMSGDPAQDYFSDGITDDLIADLSRISGLFVIARNSMFTYKGKPVKVQQVGRELGAHYVLEGSVRRSGSRVRVNAQLVDAHTGHHLWAERYDRELTDVFALQDDVTQNIVAALTVKLTPGEEERLSRAVRANPEAYDMLLRGLELFRRFTLETHVQARAFFEKAVALDPTFARAYADLALTYGENVAEGWTDAPGLSNERSLELAQHALALDDSLPVVHFALSTTYSYLTRHDEAIAAAQRAVALDSNYADGYAQLAVSLNNAGRPEAGLAAIRKAMRLNPRYPFYYVWVLGQSYFFMGRTEQAAAQFEKVVESNPHFPTGHMSLAAAYGVLDRVEDAEWEAEELLTLLPDLTLARVRQSDSYRDPAHMNLYLDGLRKAGLPQ